MRSNLVCPLPHTVRFPYNRTHNTHLVGQPYDFGYAALGRDSQPVQTRPVVRVPYVNGTVHGAGGQQPAGRVERGRRDLDRHRLAVHDRGVRQRPPGDQLAGVQVPHADYGVGAGHGYQQLEQRVVQGLHDGRVVRIVADGARVPGRVAALDRHERVTDHHHEHLVQLIEMGGVPAPMVVRGRRRHRPVQRQQARALAQVPQLDRVVRGHRVQVPVAPVDENVLDLERRAKQKKKNRRRILFETSIFFIFMFDTSIF